LARSARSHARAASASGSAGAWAGAAVRAGLRVAGDAGVGPARGVLVVAEESAERGLAFRCGFGRGLGVGADEVVHAVAARGGLGQQVVVDKFLQQPFGGTGVGAGQGRGGVGVGFRAGDQA